MRARSERRGERGATVAEFAVVALVFFMIIIGIIEFGRLLYTHNALTDATRRGARYAATHKGLSEADKLAVAKHVVYGSHLDTDGNPTSGPLINGLTTDMVTVTFVGIDTDGDGDLDTNFGSNLGSTTVSIEGYQFDLAIPLLNRRLSMPNYVTTLVAESAGEIPADIAP